MKTHIFSNPKKRRRKNKPSNNRNIKTLRLEKKLKRQVKENLNYLIGSGGQDR